LKGLMMAVMNFMLVSSAQGGWIVVVTQVVKH